MRITLQKYKHIYFDLDRTLWDFENNSKAAIENVLKKFELKELLAQFDLFIQRYNIYNERLWALYRKGQIKKSQLRVTRFHLTLKEFDINNLELAKKIDKEYIATSPRNTFLMPGTLEVLNHLSKKYSLYIITNGFKEVQNIKLHSSGLINYFIKVFTSDDIGYPKPDKRIFEAAIKSSNAKKKDCLMIGDDLDIDIIGAKKFGIDQVYFNKDDILHEEKPTFEINTLTELLKIL